MTPDDLTAWRISLGLQRLEAAALLGLSPGAWTSYQNGRTVIPRYIALACAALSAGLSPWQAVDHVGADAIDRAIAR